MMKDLPTSPSSNGHLSPGLDITPIGEAPIHFMAAVRSLVAQDWGATGDSRDAAVRVLKSASFVGGPR